MEKKQSLTSSLIVVIVGAYLLNYLFPSLQSQLWLDYTARTQPYRLITVALTHSGWLHLIFNMLALWSIGESVEKYFGKIKFAIIFFGSLLSASLASLYLGSTNLIAVGASGAIFGLFGALIAVGKRMGANYQNVTGVVVINLVLTFVIPGIDWRAHVGGFIGGFVIAYALRFFKST